MRVPVDWLREYVAVPAEATGAEVIAVQIAGLLARRIVIPHPRGGVIDVSAPLPPHMLQSWNLLGLEADRFDPIENAPEE